MKNQSEKTPKIPQVALPMKLPSRHCWRVVSSAPFVFLPPPPVLVRHRNAAARRVLRPLAAQEPWLLVGRRHANQRAFGLWRERVTCAAKFTEAEARAATVSSGQSLHWRGLHRWAAVGVRAQAAVVMRVLLRPSPG